MEKLVCEQAHIASLKPNPRNARRHSLKQIRQIAKSIARFGFTNPVLIDDGDTILAGHGRLEAAKHLGWTEAPVIRLSHMSAADKRAYLIADNKLALNAGWDNEILALELDGLMELGFDLDEVGFSAPELDLVLSAAAEADPKARDEPADQMPATRNGPPITRPGDIWLLGAHKLICGDAKDPCAYSALLGEERARVMFTDPPYNVAISGHARKTGAHREFAMASGEMNSADFEDFLRETLGRAAEHCADGAIAFVCMDWRHLREVLNAGEDVFSELKNICVWTKSNGGMGSLYRSQHELVLVFKNGDDAHCNNVELGAHGRNRTNVWAYAGVNAFKANRDEELALHPTVKPVALVEDALKDVSRRGEIVLDPFGGSGSTLIAAQRCGRIARLIELDPLYCDVIVRRFEAFTGKPARRASDSALFEALCEAA